MREYVELLFELPLGESELGLREHEETRALRHFELHLLDPLLQSGLHREHLPSDIFTLS